MSSGAGDRDIITIDGYKMMWAKRGPPALLSRIDYIRAGGEYGEVDAGCAGGFEDRGCLVEGSAGGVDVVG